MLFQRQRRDLYGRGTDSAIPSFRGQALRQGFRLLYIQRSPVSHWVVYILLYTVSYLELFPAITCTEGNGNETHKNSPTQPASHVLYTLLRAFGCYKTKRKGGETLEQLRSNTVRLPRRHMPHLKPSAAIKQGLTSPSNTISTESISNMCTPYLEPLVAAKGMQEGRPRCPLQAADLRLCRRSQEAHVPRRQHARELFFLHLIEF